MRLSCHTFSLPKSGNAPDEYEDAAWPDDATEIDASLFRCAVADGATESSFSDRWARLLVKGYVDESKLADLRKAWQIEIAEIELPWYAEQKADVGAFAALLGVELKEKNDTISFQASSIGDCCFYQMRDDKKILSFPMDSFESFDSTPALISSKSPEADQSDPQYEIKDGIVESGDTIIMLTDAIAAWTMRFPGKTNDRLLTLKSIKSLEEFEKLVAQEREDRDEEGRPAMKNDDVTLFTIDISS